MSEFDDLIDMGELVSKLGDNGEIPAEMSALATAPEAQEVTVEPVQVIEPEQHSYSGGLSGVPGIENGNKTMDLDELLGITARPPQPAEAPRGDPAPESVAPRPGSLEERVAELTARAAKLEADKDMLMARLIDGPKPVPETPEAPESALIPETQEFLRPYVEQEANRLVEQRMKPLEETLAPMLERARDERLAEAIGKHVPGLKAEHMPILHREFDAVTDPVLKSVYKNGVAGAAALAHDLVRRGALDLVKDAPRSKVSPMVARHHTEGGGPRSASGADANDEASQIAALMALPAEQFLTAWAKKFPDQ